jgi:hypothetical protein
MDVLARHSGDPAPAPLVVPGAALEWNAGADLAAVVPGSSPTFFQCGSTPEAGVPTLPGLMPDESATVVVSDGSADNEVFGQAGLDVRWTDNAIVNGDGADLAVFESDRAERFSVSLFDLMAGAFTAPRSFDPLKPLSTPILEAVSVDSATIRMGDPELPGLVAPPRRDTRCRSRRKP